VAVRGRHIVAHDQTERRQLLIENEQPDVLPLTAHGHAVLDGECADLCGAADHNIRHLDTGTVNELNFDTMLLKELQVLGDVDGEAAQIGLEGRHLDLLGGAANRRTQHRRQYCRQYSRDEPAAIYATPHRSSGCHQPSPCPNYCKSTSMPHS